MTSTASASARDTLQRPLASLRVSVTDRCNLRCRYCMPEASYAWLPRADVLSYEELAALAAAFSDVGVHEIHLTGGEPLLRRDLAAFVGMLAANPRLDDLALTTNGVLLAEAASELRRAGLHRVTVSLDTLRRERYRALAGRDLFERVRAGLEAARAAGFASLSLNTVVIRGGNDDELVDILAFGRELGAEVRFIEYMDTGGATGWSQPQVFSRDEMLTRIGRDLGRPESLPRAGPAPAERFRLADGTLFGIIASVTQPFCASCDRARLTADGQWYLCLYARYGLDLRAALRSGASREALAAIIAGRWRERDDRGAELRAALVARGPSFSRAELEHEPHLEMHVRGG